MQKRRQPPSRRLRIFSKGLKGLKGFKGFRDFKVPYRSDKAHTEGCTGSGHTAEGSQKGREQLPEQSQK